MTYLYIFFALIILGAVAARFLRKDDPVANPEAEVTTDSITQQEEEEAEECCGQHETCEKDSLLAAVSKDVEYYEDYSPEMYEQHPTLKPEGRRLLKGSVTVKFAE